MNADQLRALQAPLKNRYRDTPAAALVTLRAAGTLDDADIVCKLDTGRALIAAGLHPATGGDGVEIVLEMSGSAAALDQALRFATRGGRISLLGIFGEPVAMDLSNLFIEKGLRAYGIFGRRIATEPGYDFSPALRKLDIVWTPETLSKLFEIGPAAYTPGTKMPEQRVGAEDRAALVKFLEKATRP